jgi:hypothetical protein
MPTIPDWEDCSLKPAKLKKKKIARPPSRPIKLGTGAHICHPSYAGGINKRIIV